MQCNTILQGDAWQLAQSLPDESINCIVTSPPYFGLRDYGEDGQFGLEATPEEFVDKLVDLFRELRRALRHDGTLWLNLGDSYSGSGGAGGDYAPGGLKDGQPRYPGRKVSSLKPKNLIGIPWRVAFALQADGWYLRSEIIWHKTAAMPESVTDRPTRAHEQIFLLTKSASYFYDADAIREPYRPSSLQRIQSGWNGQRQRGYLGTHQNNMHRYMGTEQGAAAAQRGANKRSVWSVGPEPSRAEHYAAYPSALVRPCVLAGCPHRVCSQCGAPWVRVVERTDQVDPRAKGSRFDVGKTGMNGQGRTQAGERTLTETTGRAPTCDCVGDTQPGLVLDPFMGSGTTAVVARSLGRDWLGFELNPAYVELAYGRIDATQPPLLME